MKPLKPAIHFHYLHRPFHFDNRQQLKKFITAIFKYEKVLLNELHYIFCSDEYLLTLNRHYLGHNTYTDIITFTLSEHKEPVLGDIYISIDRIHENTFNQETTFKEELHRVIFHGALHLCGYYDKTITQQKQMRKKENYYLNRYFVSRETI